MVLHIGASGSSWYSAIASMGEVRRIERSHEMKHTSPALFLVQMRPALRGRQTA